MCVNQEMDLKTLQSTLAFLVSGILSHKYLLETLGVHIQWGSLMHHRPVTHLGDVCVCPKSKPKQMGFVIIPCEVG